MKTQGIETGSDPVFSLNRRIAAAILCVLATSLLGGCGIVARVLPLGAPRDTFPEVTQQDVWFGIVQEKLLIDDEGKEYSVLEIIDVDRVAHDARFILLREGNLIAMSEVQVGGKYEIRGELQRLRLSSREYESTSTKPPKWLVDPNMENSSHGFLCVDVSSIELAE